MKKAFIFTLFVLAMNLQGLPSFSDLALNMSENDLEKMEEKGYGSRESSLEEGLIWLPEHSLNEKIEAIYKEWQPGMAVEIVNLISMEEGIPSSPDFLRQVTNKFLNVSEQKGIQYYSSSRKKELVLIEDSYSVDSFESQLRVDDYEFDSIPDVADIVIYQKDANFGGNYFDYHCEIFDDGTILTTTNRTNLTVMKILTVAKPNENIMIYALIPCAEGLYVYTAIFVNDPPKKEKILGVSVNINGFFRKRVNKIVEWFSENFILI
jgi:hypothetical protein